MNKLNQESRVLILKRFEWSVRSLAQPSHVQMNLFPNFTCVADELALEFEEWRGRFLDVGSNRNLSSDQKRLMEDLYAQLARMSGEKNAELWTDTALADSEEWMKVRNFAEALTSEMGWSNSPPPIDRGDKFVGDSN